jgi:hypothetical protein
MFMFISVFNKLKFKSQNMDLITVVIIGVIVAATGVINPKPKSPDEVAKAPETQITTPVVKLSQNLNQNQYQNQLKSLSQHLSL